MKFEDESDGFNISDFNFMMNEAQGMMFDNMSSISSRKSQQQLSELMNHFHKYKGYWDNELFSELLKKTGFSKKQLNKWFWDRKKKETEQMEFKKLSYPGLIFRVECTRTGKDLTPSFRNLCCKPIFKIERVSKQDRATELANSC